MADADHLGEHRLELSDRLPKRKVARANQFPQFGKDLLGIGELLGEGRVTDMHEGEAFGWSVPAVRVQSRQVRTDP
jgi:hypothetical protein